MGIFGEQIISKIVDEGTASALTQYRIARDDFPTEAERQAYDYIVRYAQQNGGKAPSYASITAEVPEITYLPGVTDSYEHLARELKDAAAKRRIAEIVNGYVDADGKRVGSEFAEAYKNKSAEEFAGYLKTLADEIKMRTSVCQKATDVKTDYDRFLDEYRARKAGQSFKIWRSAFPYINTQIGGFLSSNMYTWYARSGRGKSVIVMVEALESALQGATVLVWALEMSAFEWMARAYSYLSARAGVIRAQIDGVDYDAGFDNKAMLMGRLGDEYERELAEFLRTLNDSIPGRIILRAVDDEDFTDRSVRQLDADILQYKADVVVVDPIYYMDYETNTSKTAGGDAAATSKKLRLLAGRTKTVLHVITQADENSGEKGDDGIRELMPPKRAEIKKTKAVLEDAANTFGVDTLAHEGRGVIELGKGRNGGEDARVEIVYLPNFGIVREINDESESSMFEAPF